MNEARITISVKFEAANATPQEQTEMLKKIFIDALAHVNMATRITTGSPLQVGAVRLAEARIDIISISGGDGIITHAQIPGHTTYQTVCRICGHRQLSAVPADAPPINLQCANCHQMSVDAEGF